MNNVLNFREFVKSSFFHFSFFKQSVNPWLKVLANFRQEINQIRRKLVKIRQIESDQRRRHIWWWFHVKMNVKNKLSKRVSPVYISNIILLRWIYTYIQHFSCLRRQISLFSHHLPPLQLGFSRIFFVNPWMSSIAIDNLLPL